MWGQVWLSPPAHPKRALPSGILASGFAGAGQAGCAGLPGPGNLARVWEKCMRGPLSQVFLPAKGLAWPVFFYAQDGSCSPEPHKDNRSGSVSANPRRLYTPICRGSQSGMSFY